MSLLWSNEVGFYFPLNNHDTSHHGWWVLQIGCFILCPCSKSFIISTPSRRKPNSTWHSKKKLPRWDSYLPIQTPTHNLHTILCMVPKDKKLFYTSMPLLTLLTLSGKLFSPTPPSPYRNISPFSLSRISSSTALLWKYSSIKTTVLVCWDIKLTTDSSVFPPESVHHSIITVLKMFYT